MKLRRFHCLFTRYKKHNRSLSVHYCRVFKLHIDIIQLIWLEAIKEALVDYRTKTYKKNRIKAYQVFKNIAADRIAKFAPTSIEDLESLRCFDKNQIELYGQDVIDIVKTVLANY